MTPSLATSDRADARLRKAAQLAEPVLSFVEGLGQGLPIVKIVRPRGQSAGVREKEVESRRNWVFSLAIDVLSEVFAVRDRLASNWGLHADNNAWEIIWNGYRMILADIGKPIRKDFVYSR